MKKQSRRPQAKPPGYIVEASSGFGSSCGCWEPKTFPDLPSARWQVWEYLRHESVFANWMYHRYKQRVPHFEEGCCNSDHYKEEWFEARVKDRDTGNILEEYTIGMGFVHSPNLLDLVKTYSETALIPSDEDADEKTQTVVE
ncbi:hypothetical protein QOT17_006829 [Balamuthia mandrillaris]